MTTTTHNTERTMSKVSSGVRDCVNEMKRVGEAMSFAFDISNPDIVDDSEPWESDYVDFEYPEL